MGVSVDFFPLVGDFIFEGCGLSVVLGELFPILGQSLAWFEGEAKRMSEVRSSELETGLSFSVAQWRVTRPSLPLIQLGLFTPLRRRAG